MRPAIICPDCHAELPLDGATVSCDCGWSWEGLDGLGTRGGGSGESEKDVQRAIKDMLDVLGFHVSDLSQGYRADGSTRQTPGLPDLWAAHPEWKLSLWIEVKGPKTPVRPSQTAWHVVAKEAGAHVVVARSVVDVTEYLARIGAPLESE